MIAPFSRGYAPTEIPADGAYQVGALARDAHEVARVLGAERAVLIGHDWTSPGPSCRPAAAPNGCPAVGTSCTWNAPLR